MRKLAENISKRIAQHKKSRRMTTTLTAIAGILVFLTVYTLILPALALEEEAYCGLQEHEHTEDCYEQVLTCTKEEHVHTDACYDEDGNVICGKEEHTHSSKCYKETLTCGKERHVHTAACYEKPAPEEVTKGSTQIQEEVANAAKSAGKEDIDKSSDGTTNQKNANKDKTKEKNNTEKTTADKKGEDKTEKTEATTQEKEHPEVLVLSEHFTDRTGIWYQEISSDQSDKSEAPVWKKVDKKTTLDPDSLVRVHFAFQIPKDSLDGSTFESVYVLPKNIDITEDTAYWLNDDINAVNQVITGTATPDKDSDKKAYLAGKYQLVLNEDDRWQLEIMWDPYVLVENAKSTINVWTDMYLTGSALLPQKDGSYEIVFAKKADDQKKVSVEFAGMKEAEPADAVDDTGDAEGTVTDTAADATSETKEDKDHTDHKDPEADSGEKTEVTSEAEKATKADDKDKDVPENSSKKEETSESKDSESATSKDSTKKNDASEKTKNISDNSGNDSTSADDADKDGKDQNEEKEVTEEAKTLTFDGEDYTVTVSYDSKAQLPEDAKLDVREIKATKGDKAAKEEYENYYDQAVAAIRKENNANVTSARFFDITFVSGQKEIEPAAPVNVKIEYKKAEAIDEDTEVAAIHMPEKADSEVLDVEVNTDKSGVKEVEFTADSFSVYGIVYTVDFAYEVDEKIYTYSIPGGSTITLKDLLVGIGIKNKSEVDEFVEKQIDTVKFSDESLVKLTHQKKTLGLFGNEDWILESIRSFDTEETLAISLKDGSQIKITLSVSGEEPHEFGAATITSASELFLPEDVDGHGELIADEKSENAITAVQKYAHISEKGTEYKVFDIGLNLTDEQIAEYKNGFKVDVDLPEGAVGKDFKLYHIHNGKTEEIKDLELDSKVLEGQTEYVTGFSFMTSDFSEFVLIYTIDFEFNGFTFSYPGKVPFYLSDLLFALHIDVDTSAVKDVRFSGNDLFVVGKEDGDWLIQGVESFKTIETMTMVLSDGNEYVIYVTDPVTDATINLNDVDASGKSKDVTTFKATVSKAVQNTEQGRDSSFKMNMAFELTDEAFQKLQNASGFPTIAYDLSSYINDPDVPLESIADMSQPIYEGDTKVGQVRVENGVVVITITNLDWLASQTRLDADFDLLLKTSSSKLGTRDEYNFDFPGTTEDFTIKYKKITFDSSKSVSYNGRDESGNVVLTEGEDGKYHLTYTVTLNNPTELDSLNFSDTMTGKQKLEGSVTISGGGKTATVSVNEGFQNFGFDVKQALGLDTVPSGQYTVTYSTVIEKDDLKTIGESGATEEKNTATWKVNGDKEVKPEPTTITPHKDRPPMEVTKKVNGKEGTDQTGWAYGSTLNYEIQYGSADKPMAGITISDEMTDNQKIVGTITVKYADGSTETITPNSAASDNSYSNGTVKVFDYKLKDNAGNGPVTVTYQAQVISKDDAIANGVYGTQSVRNKAYSENKSSEVEGKVTFPDKPEQKKTVTAASGTTNGKWQLGDTLTYTLTYGSKDIPLGGTTITDVMTKLQNLNAGSIKINIPGKAEYLMPSDAVTWTNLNNASDFSTETAQVFNYTFPEESGNGPVTITYTTTLISQDQVKQLNISGDQSVNNTMTVNNNPSSTSGKIPTNEPNKVSKSVKNLTDSSRANWKPGDEVEYTIVLEGDRLNGSVVSDYATDIQELTSDIVIKDKNGATVAIISKDGNDIGADFKDTSYSTNSKKLFEYTIPDGNWTQPLTATYTMKIIDAEIANQDMHLYGLQGTNNSVETDRGGRGTTGNNTDFGEKPVVPKEKTVSPVDADTNGEEANGWQPGQQLNYTLKFGDGNTKMAGYYITDRMTNLQHLIVPQPADPASAIPAGASASGTGILITYVDLNGQTKTIEMPGSAITSYGEDDYSTNLVQLFTYTLPDDAGYGEVTITYSTQVISLKKATEKKIYDLQPVENRFTFDGETVTTWGDVPFKDDPKPKKNVTPQDDDEVTLTGNGSGTKGWQPGQELTYTVTFGDETTVLNGRTIKDRMSDIQTLVGDVVVSWKDDNGKPKSFVMPTSTDPDNPDGVCWGVTHIEGKYTYDQWNPDNAMKTLFNYKLPGMDVLMPDGGPLDYVGRITGPVTVTYKTKVMTQTEAEENGLYGELTLKNTFELNGQTATTQGDVPYEDKADHIPAIKKTGFVDANGNPVWPEYEADGTTQKSHKPDGTDYEVYDAPEGAHTNIDLSTGRVTWIMEVSAAEGSTYPLTDITLTEKLQQSNSNVGSSWARLDQLMQAGLIDAVTAEIVTASGTVLNPGADYSVFFSEEDNPWTIAEDERQTVYNGQKNINYFFPTITEPTYIKLNVYFKDSVVGSYRMNNNAGVKDSNGNGADTNVFIGGLNTNIVVNKEGKYDDKDNRYVEWTIDINKETQVVDPDWEQVLFSDILPDGMEVVNWNDPSDHDHPTIRVQTWGKSYTNENYLYFPVNVTNGEIQPVDIHPIYTASNQEFFMSGMYYQVKYKTYIDDETWDQLTSSESGSLTFSNTAMFTDGGTQTYSGSTDVTVKEDDFIDKKDVSQGRIVTIENDDVLELSGNTLSYLIDVNPNGYNMNNGADLKLSDTIPSSMNFNAPSLKVYKVTDESIEAMKRDNKAKLDRETMYDVNDELIEEYMGEDITNTLQISYNDDTRVLTIDGIPDGQYYRVFFTAGMRSTGGDQVETFTNTVSLFGAGSYSATVEEKHTSSEFSAHIHGGLSMRKLDENNIKKALEGAVFELYKVTTTDVDLSPVTKNGQVVSYTVTDKEGAAKTYRAEQITVGADENGQYTSDKNGNIKFGSYQFESNTLYYWIEKQEPEGYIAELDVPHHFVLYTTVDDSEIDEYEGYASVTAKAEYLTQLNMYQAWALDNYWEDSYGIKVASYPAGSTWYATNSQYRSITATKKWEGDSNNLYLTRPEDGIKLTLIRINADGSETELDTKMINGGNTAYWPSYTWQKLPIYDDDGNELKYTVKEEPVSGYYAEYSDGGNGIKNGQITITNRPTPGKTSVEVEKVWKTGGEVPNSIQVQLIQIYTDKDNNTFQMVDGSGVPYYENLPNGMDTYTTTTLIPDGKGKWGFTWNNLPTKDTKGGKYSYTVKEISELAEDVTVEYSDKGEGIVKGKITITNIKPGSILLKKKVTVNGKPTEGTEADGTYTFNIIDADGNTVKTVSMTIVNGQAQELKVDGLTEGDYTVREVMPTNGTTIAAGTPKEYSLTVVAGVTSGLEVPVAEFTNNKDTTRLTVKKNWFTDSTDWPKDGTATIRLVEVGEDGSQTPVTDHLDTSGNNDSVIELNEDQQSYTWTSLDPDKKYTVTEDPLIGFITEISEVNDKQVVTVTNKESTNLTFHKEWSGAVPSNWMAEVKLIQRERAIVEYGEPVKNVPAFSGEYTDTDTDHVFVTNSDPYTFDDLPKYRHDGNTVYEIEYSVAEVKITIDNEDVTDQYTGVITGTQASGLTMTNTPSKKLPVEKIWDGDIPSDIASIELRLYDGSNIAKEVDGVTEVPAITLPAKDDQGNDVRTAVFERLPKDSNYTLKETKVTYTNGKSTTDQNAIALIFGAKVADKEINGKIGKSVTNKPETIDIPVKKTWGGDIDENTSGLNVQYTLYSVTTNKGVEKETRVKTDASGNSIQNAITLNRSRNWVGTWSNLPKYDVNGNEIIYRVRETRVQANGTTYTTTISITNNWGEDTWADVEVPSGSSTANEVNLTNTPATVELDVTKRWSGYTPDTDTSVELTLFRNGQPAKEDGSVASTNAETFKFSLPTQNGSWTDSISGLPKYDRDGNLITWSVQETKIVYTEGGDQVTLEGDEIKNIFTVDGEGNFTFSEGSDAASKTIANFKEPTPDGDKMKVTLNKVWNDGTEVPDGATATFTLHRAYQAAPEAGNQVTVNLYYSDGRTLAGTYYLDKSAGTKLFFQSVNSDVEVKIYNSKDNSQVGNAYKATLAPDRKVYDGSITLNWDMTEEGVLNLYMDKAARDFTKAPALSSDKEWTTDTWTRTITLSDDSSTDWSNNGTWSYIFSDLVKRDTDGKQYRYWITEDSKSPESFVNTSFTTGDSANPLSSDGEVTITNKENPKITVTKEWKSGDTEIEPPIKTIYFKLKAKIQYNASQIDDYRVPNTYFDTGDGKNLNYKQDKSGDWYYVNQYDTTNSDKIFVLRYSDGDWSSISFENLPSHATGNEAQPITYYIVECDEYGNEYSSTNKLTVEEEEFDTTYTFKGEAVSETSRIAGDDTGTAIITNKTPIPEKIDVEVEKAWETSDDTAPTAWPEDVKVEVTLYQIVSGVKTVVAKSVESTQSNWENPVTLEDLNGKRTFKWEGLPNLLGDDKYVVEETAVTKGAGSLTAVFPLQNAEVDKLGSKVTLTNTEDTVDIPVTKAWRNNNNGGNDHISYTLYRTTTSLTDDDYVTVTLKYKAQTGISGSGEDTEEVYEWQQKEYRVLKNSTLKLLVDHAWWDPWTSSLYTVTADPSVTITTNTTRSISVGGTFVERIFDIAKITEDTTITIDPKNLDVGNFMTPIIEAIAPVHDGEASDFTANLETVETGDVKKAGDDNFEGNADDWKHVIENLPKYKVNADGMTELYYYYVFENGLNVDNTTNLSRFDTDYSDAKAATNADTGLAITNKIRAEYTWVEVKKVWKFVKDTPANVRVVLYRRAKNADGTSNVTNPINWYQEVYITENNSLYPDKKWTAGWYALDPNYDYFIREVVAGGENYWFDDAESTKYEVFYTDADGNDLGTATTTSQGHTITVHQVPTGETAGTVSVTNKGSDVTVTKEWAENTKPENASGTPEYYETVYLKVHLERYYIDVDNDNAVTRDKGFDGTEKASPVVFKGKNRNLQLWPEAGSTSEGATVGSQTSEWKATWTGLEVTDTHGNDYIYKVVEDGVIMPFKGDNHSYTTAVDVTNQYYYLRSEDGLTITNYPNVTDIDLTKNMVDGSETWSAKFELQAYRRLIAKDHVKMSDEEIEAATNTWSVWNTKVTKNYLDTDLKYIDSADKEEEEPAEHSLNANGQIELSNSLSAVTIKDLPKYYTDPATGNVYELKYTVVEKEVKVGGTDKTTAYNPSITEGTSPDYEINVDNMPNDDGLLVRKDWEGGSIPAGASVTITIGRLKFERIVPKGKLTVTNNNSGDTNSADYVLTGASTGATRSFTLAKGESWSDATLPADTYTVRQTVTTTAPTDTTLNVATAGLTGASTDGTVTTGTVSVAENADVSVAFTNTFVSANKVTVVLGSSKYSNPEAQYTTSITEGGSIIIESDIKVYVYYWTESSGYEGNRVNYDNTSIEKDSGESVGGKWRYTIPSITERRCVGIMSKDNSEATWRALDASGNELPLNNYTTLMSAPRRRAASSTAINQTNTTPTVTVPEGFEAVEDNSTYPVVLPNGTSWSKYLTNENTDGWFTYGNADTKYYYYIKSVTETGIPEGTTCVISSATVSESNKATALTVTNTVPKGPGSLKITKKVTVNTLDPAVSSNNISESQLKLVDGKYTFIIKKNGNPVDEGKVNGTDIVDGKAEITITNGVATTVEVTDLSEGDYTIEEQTPTNGASFYSATPGVKVENGIATVHVTGDQSGSAVVAAAMTTFTNNVYTNDLELTKKVTGDGADETKKFTFSVKIDVPNNVADTTYKAYLKGTETTAVTVSNHTATVTGIKLAHNDKYRIEGLPNGTTYTITETADNGYTADAVTKTGTITANSSNDSRTEGRWEKVTVTNTKKYSFTFEKEWQNVSGQTLTTWPQDKEINVQIFREANDQRKDDFQLDYTINKSNYNIEGGISPDNTSKYPENEYTTAQKLKLVSGTTFMFEMEGLVKEKGDETYTYYVKETSLVDGYDEAKYYQVVGGTLKETEKGVANDGKANDGGKIVNKENTGYELPHTGGIGTTLFTLIGSILVLLSGALLLIRRRRLTPVRVTDSSSAAHKPNTISKGGGSPI